MNAKVTLSAIVASLCMLTAGCSTVPSTSQVAESHVESSDFSSKVARVNRRNSARGIDTVWVNPPRKQREDDDGR